MKTDEVTLTKNTKGKGKSLWPKPSENKPAKCQMEKEEASWRWQEVVK